MLISVKFSYLYFVGNFLWASAAKDKDNLGDRWVVWVIFCVSLWKIHATCNRSPRFSFLLLYIYIYIYYINFHLRSQLAGNGKTFLQQNNKLFKMQNVAYEWFKANTNTICICIHLHRHIRKYIRIEKCVTICDMYELYSEQVRRPRPSIYIRPLWRLFRYLCIFIGFQHTMCTTSFYVSFVLLTFY